MTNKSGIKLETDGQGSRMYLVDENGNETLTSEVKVDKDERLLSGIKIDADKLNIVHPDSDGREKFLDTNFIESSDLKISDEFIQKLTSRTSFIESLKAIDLKLNSNEITNLIIEMSALKSEVFELKQKLEEK